jgi:hypothetical protein
MIHGELLTHWLERPEVDGSVTVYPAVEDVLIGSGTVWRVRDSTAQPEPPTDPNAYIVEFWSEPAALDLMIAAGAYLLWSVEL